MSTRLEDYSLLADMHTGPLVSAEGSIDWLCLPRFDSPAVFSAILGSPDDGRWRLSIAEGHVVDRRYAGNTFILETLWQAPDGTARVTDFLPPGESHANVVRVVECLDGQVEVTQDLRLRLSYGRVVPWLHKEEAGLAVTAGPDGLLLTGPGMDTDPENRSGGQITQVDTSTRLRAGERADWQLIWFPSYEPLPEPVDPDEAHAAAVAYWESWSAGLNCTGPYAEPVRRSLLVLRALTNSETGGIVAAPTTSLPELFGGSRNWDYRFTWLRDAALTIEAVVEHSSGKLARLWRNWLLRAVAGDVSQLQIMYGIAGERELPEQELSHLRGYEDSRPVRIGNGAVSQYQADVVGEVMIALGKLREKNVAEDSYSWELQKHLLHFCEVNFDRKDRGIWETRGDDHYFTHGRVMMWAAFDQGVRAVHDFGLDGPAEHWAQLRDRLAQEINKQGYNDDLGSFAQTYDNTEVDASLLQLPHAGFIDYDDPRMLSTVERIEQDLRDDFGLIHRYRTEAGLDGLEGREYPFLMCSFWLVEQYAHTDRHDEAEKLMDLLLGLSGPLGLLSEEYDPESGRLAGNYPQAFSHLALVRAADAIALAAGRSPAAGAKKVTVEPAEDTGRSGTHEVQSSSASPRPPSGEPQQDLTQH